MAAMPARARAFSFIVWVRIVAVRAIALCQVARLPILGQKTMTWRKKMAL
jgi:hypothetical protein